MKLGLNLDHAGKSRYKAVLLAAFVCGILVTLVFSKSYPLIIQKISKQKLVEPVLISNLHEIGMDRKINIAQELLFIRNGDVWSLTKSGDEVQQTEADGGVSTFAFDKSKRLLATIEGEKITNSSGYTYINPSTVILRDLEGQKKTILLSMPFKSFPNQEYTIQLCTVAFSDDGNELAITSNDSLWIYSTTKHQIKRIFYKPVKDFRVDSLVFGYYRPRFSPDGNLLLLSKGYYEGNDFIVVDLKTGMISDLPFHSGINPSDYVLGWLPWDGILVGTTGDETFIRTFWIHQGKAGRECEMMSISDKPLSINAVKNRVLYMINRDFLSSKTEQILSFDMDKRETKVLFSRKILDPFYFSKLTLEGNKLLITEDSTGDSYDTRHSTIYAFDLDTREIGQIIQNGNVN